MIIYTGDTYWVLDIMDKLKYFTTFPDTTAIFMKICRKKILFHKL